MVVFLAPLASYANTPEDTYYSDLWYLDTISAPSAWNVTVGSRETVIAVLDAGVDIDHPDLEGNLWSNPGEIANNGVDDDGNGFVDDINGWNFIEKNNNVNPNGSIDADPEAASHGSLIAGLIGAVGDNSEGVTGINWNVSIMPVRMLDELGSGNSVDAREAIRYAVDNGADVINLSFSGNSPDPLLAQAIERAYNAGVVIVAALGNENTNTEFIPAYPACYGEGESADWVIGVASTSRMDQKSSFSNYGSDCVDISAPGEDIFGVSYYDPSEGFDDLYAGFWSGTSMAAPMVSGAAGLLLSAYPTLTPEDVSLALRLSVDPLDLAPAFTGKMGSGRLNLAQALEIASQFAEEDVEIVETVDDVEVVNELIGHPITAPVSSAVYYVEDGERRAFINEMAYFTHFGSFAEVMEVSDSEISTYTLSGLMLPKAGTVLVKIQSDPRVYLLEENPLDPFAPVLRAIDTEEIAIEMYGVNWADFVIDIEPTFFSKFAVGAIVTSAFTVDTSIMKTRDELAQLAQ